MFLWEKVSEKVKPIFNIVSIIDIVLIFEVVFIFYIFLILGALSFMMSSKIVNFHCTESNHTKKRGRFLPQVYRM